MPPQTYTTLVSRYVNDKTGKHAAENQISASRTLIALINTRALRPSNGSTDLVAISEAFEELQQTTDALARVVYGHTANTTSE